jgi:hypothetical protein
MAEISPRAALLDVEIATRSRRRADEDSAIAMRQQADTIRAAIAAGCSLTEIAAKAELSVERIRQIRDGVR